MVDKIRLKLMRRKPTLDDIVKADTNSDADLVFRVSLVNASKDQKKVLEKAARIKFWFVNVIDGKDKVVWAVLTYFFPFARQAS